MNPNPADAASKAAAAEYEAFTAAAGAWRPGAVDDAAAAWRRVAALAEAAAIALDAVPLTQPDSRSTRQ